MTRPQNHDPASWTPCYLDDIIGNPLAYDTTKVFGLPELCAIILEAFVPDIFDHEPYGEARRAPLISLLRCRQVCRSWRNVIDDSSKLRQALFLSPSSDVPRVLNCFRPPHLAPFIHHDEFYDIPDFSSTTEPPLLGVDTSITMSRALKWKATGALWESMHPMQGPLRTMSVVAYNRSEDSDCDYLRDVESTRGLTYKDLMEEARIIAHDVPKKARKSTPKIDFELTAPRLSWDFTPGDGPTPGDGKWCPSGTQRTNCVID